MAHFPLIVIGGGPAGLSAAVEATARGVRTLLIDERPAPGGAVCGDLPTRPDEASDWLLPPVLDGEHQAVVDELVEGLKRYRVQTALNSFAWALFREERWQVPVFREGMTVRYTADCLVLATGCFVAPDPVFDTARKGVLTPAVFYRKLMAGCLRGRTIVVYGAGRLGHRLARLAVSQGVEVAGLFSDAAATDPSTDARAAAGEAAPFRTIAVDAPPRLTRSDGDSLVLDVRSRTAGAAGEVSGDSIAVDHVVVASPVSSAYELAMLAGCELRFAGYRRGFLPRIDARTMASSVDGVYCAGTMAGVGEFEAVVASGRLAAVAVAERLNRAPGGIARRHGALDAAGAGIDTGAERDVERTLYGRLPEENDAFVVCPCVGVTKGQVVAAARTGARTLDDLKRMSGLGMGYCQGRCCQRGAYRLMTFVHGDGPLSAGAGLDGHPLKVRPPIRPLPLIGLLSTEGEEESRSGLEAVRAGEKAGGMDG